ncbi:hypothetical protein PC114_g21690 [Phytophthora cactorum]|nr:hypothetical protein PC114_g21690 [Phytophthora cactorum]
MQLMLTAVEILDEAHRLENELQSDKLMESDALLTTEDENCDAETEVCTQLSQTRRRIWGMWYELSNKPIVKELVDAKRRGLDVLTLRNIEDIVFFSLSRSCRAYTNIFAARATTERNIENEGSKKKQRELKKEEANEP